MTHLQTTSSFFRSLLGWALILSLVAKSTVGAAIVLHRHGILGTHWHMVGSLDLSQHAALSSAFGHPGGRHVNLKGSLGPVRTLAVVGVGLIYISCPRDAQFNHNATTWHGIVESLHATIDQTIRGLSVTVTNPSACQAVRHADAILLGSHALLI